MAASSLATGKRSDYLTPNSRPFGDSVVVEIGAMNHAAEHLSSEPERAVVDALADTLLRVRSRNAD